MHDLVTLGEVLLRLAAPSPARFETVRQLDLQFGGAEANVAAADLDLTDEDDARLTEASDAFSPRRGIGVAPQIVHNRLRR